MSFFSKNDPKKLKKFLIIIFIFLILGTSFFALSFLKKRFFLSNEYANFSANIEKAEEQKKMPAHIKTPESVRGIYMTSWVAGTKDWKADIIKMIDETELNSIVVDVKDYTGRISFKISDPELKEIGAEENRIPNIEEFINTLHQKNIYVIARISVFQDAYFVKKRPDLAVKKKSGGIWEDYKGISWLNPASREVWDYTIKIAKECDAVGFDELNFDYIRYPSDGNMKDIILPFAEGASTKAESMRVFFSYLSEKLKPLNLPLSADLFGLTTWNYDDLNIGQVLEYAAPYFDYICPMVYPSHYPKGFQNFKNPADHPYEIINSGMVRASERLLKASSTPSKLRPWLQDFDLGAQYTAEMIRQEKKAVYDAGLNSWLMWDPSNKYTKSAFNLE